MPMIMAAHRIPYVATACPSFPVDLVNKLRKAKEIKGTKYIHILAPCPTGWRYDASKTVELGKLAVQTGLWALYEIENGKFKLNSPSDRLVDKSRCKPVIEYFAPQARFRNMADQEIKRIEQWLNEDWEHYRKLIADSAPDSASY